MDGAFSSYNVLTTLPYIFKQNKCNQGCYGNTWII